MGDPAKPIVSTRADDPSLYQAIDAFVLALAECVDHLQDAESAGNLARLQELARTLAAQSEPLGYAPLAELAEALAAAAAEKPEEVHARLVELTDVAQRVRRGHRGAL